MTEPKAVRTDVTPADMDPQGNVVVWDHGPPDGEADAQAWHDKHGAGPVPIIMHASDAGHALTVDPERYALEPLDIDDAEVEAEVEAIQERRAAAEKAAADHAAAIQIAADRKVAIATVMARRIAAANEDPKPEPQPEPVHRDPLVDPDPEKKAAAEEHAP